MTRNPLHLTYRMLETSSIFVFFLINFVVVLDSLLKIPCASNCNIFKILFMWVFLPFVLFFVCEKVSYLGLYHSIRPKYDIDGELFVTKIYKVFTCNCYLSLPLMLAIYGVMVTSINSPVHINYVILTGSLIILLLARVAVNPGKLVVGGVSSRYSDLTIEQLACKQKDLMQSFFHSFICAAILIQIIIQTHAILNSNNVFQNVYLTYEPISLVKTAIIYYGSLLFVTVLGEVSISRFRSMTPRITCSYKCKDQNIERVCRLTSSLYEYGKSFRSKLTKI